MSITRSVFTITPTVPLVSILPLIPLLFILSPAPIFRISSWILPLIVLFSLIVLLSFPTVSPVVSAIALAPILIISLLLLGFPPLDLWTFLRVCLSFHSGLFRYWRSSFFLVRTHWIVLSTDLFHLSHCFYSFFHFLDGRWCFTDSNIDLNDFFLLFLFLTMLFPQAVFLFFFIAIFLFLNLPLFFHLLFLLSLRVALVSMLIVVLIVVFRVFFLVLIPPLFVEAIIFSLESAHRRYGSFQTLWLICVWLRLLLVFVFGFLKVRLVISLWHITEYYLVSYHFWLTSQGFSKSWYVPTSLYFSLSAPSPFLAGIRSKRYSSRLVFSPLLHSFISFVP